MANQIEKLDGITIANIAKLDGRTDDNIQALNGREFTGSTDFQKISFTTVDSGGSAIGDAGEFNTGRSYGTSLAFDPDTSQFIIMFSDTLNSERPTIRIGTVSGTTITFGNKIEVETHSNANTTGCYYDTAKDRLITVWMSSSTGRNGIYAKGFKLNSSRGVDGTGTLATVDTASSGYNQTNASNFGAMNQNDENGNSMVDVLYEDGDDSSHNYARTVMLDDHTNADDDASCSLNVGSAAEFSTDSSNRWGIASDGTKNCIVYQEGSSVRTRTIQHFTQAISFGTYDDLSLSGMEMTFADAYGGTNMVYDPDNDCFHVAIKFTGSSSGNAVNGNVYILKVTLGGSDDKVASFQSIGNPLTNLTNAGTISSGTYTNNVTGGGLIYSHARDRIISHGSANAGHSVNNATINAEIHSYNGSTYTSGGSSNVIDIETRNGQPRNIGTLHVDASAIFGTVVPIASMLYGGTNDGTTFIHGIDAGDAAIN